MNKYIQLHPVWTKSPHKAMEKNEQSKLQTDTAYLNSLDACTLMEMKLKTNMGEHSSWTRQL